MFKLQQWVMGVLFFGTFSTVQARGPKAQTRYFKQHPYFKQLEALSFTDRDALYLSGEVPKRLPSGYAAGYPYLPKDRHTLNTVAHLAWQGKGFEVNAEDPLTAHLYNRFFGVRILEGSVWIGNFRDVLRLPTAQESYGMLYRGDKRRLYLDDEQAVLMIYENSSIPVGRKIKNELRQIWTHDYSDLYLGRSTIDGKFWLHFALKFPKQSEGR